MTDLVKIYLEEKVVRLMGQVCQVHSFKVNLLSKPKKKSGFCFEMGEKYYILSDSNIGFESVDWI
jgi:hypothetical protein